MLKKPRHGHSDHKKKMTVKERKATNHLKLVQTRKSNDPYIAEHSNKNKKKKAAQELCSFILTFELLTRFFTMSEIIKNIVDTNIP